MTLRQLDLGRLDLDLRGRRGAWDLGLDGLRLDLLDWDRLDEAGELLPVIHGLLRGGADDDDDERDDDVEGDGGEERRFALLAIVEHAEVRELDLAGDAGVFTAKRLVVIGKIP